MKKVGQPSPKKMRYEHCKAAIPTAGFLRVFLVVVTTILT